MTFEEWWKIMYPGTYTMTGNLVEQRMEQKRIAKEAWKISKQIHAPNHEHKFEPRYCRYEYLERSSQNFRTLYSHDICITCGKIIKIGCDETNPIKSKRN